MSLEMEREPIRMQGMVDEIDMQHKRLEILSHQQNELKKNLVLFKFVKVFKERHDIYHVTAIVSKDLVEAEMLSGEKVYNRNIHFGSFLVVGVILPATFHYSLVENKFNMNISVQCGMTRLSQQVLVVKEHTFVVIPWTEFPIGAEVVVSLFGIVNGKRIVFKIPSLKLDLSHFIRPLQNTKNVSEFGKCKQKILEISKLYRPDIKCFYNDYKLAHMIIAPNGDELLNILMKNFPPHVKKFQNTGNYEFEIIRDTSMSSIVSLKRNGHFLEILTDVRNLYELKKYFTEQLYINDIQEIRALKKFLIWAARDGSNKEGKDAYHFLRNLWQIVLQ